MNYMDQQPTDAAKEQAYQAAVKPYLAPLAVDNGHQVPDTYADAVPGLTAIKAKIAQLGLQSGGQGLINVGAGGAVFDPVTKKPLFQNTSEKPQLIQAADGSYAWATPGGSAVPVTYGGAGGQQPMQQAPSGQMPQGAMQQKKPLAQIYAEGAALANQGGPGVNSAAGDQYVQQQMQANGYKVNPTADGQPVMGAPKGGGPVSMLSADDVKSLGLPAGTVAQREANGKVSILEKPGEGDKVPLGYQYNADHTALQPIPGGPADSASQLASTGMSPDAITDAAWDKILNGKDVPGMGKAAVQQRAAIRNQVAEIAKDAGVSPQDLVTTQGRNKALQASLTNLQKQGDVMAKNEETFNNNAQVMLNLSDQVGRSGIPAFNNLILNAKNNIQGDPTTASFLASRNLVAQEYAKIASGATGAAGSTEGAQEHALSLINTAQTPDQLRSVIGTLGKDIQGQKQATADQLNIVRSHMSDFGAHQASPAGQAGPIQNQTQANQPAQSGWSIQKVQ